METKNSVAEILLANGLRTIAAHLEWTAAAIARRGREDSAKHLRTLKKRLEEIANDIDHG